MRVCGCELRLHTNACDETVRDGKNLFGALMEAVKTHSLGQISHALCDVGGEYRRNM